MTVTPTGLRPRAGRGITAAGSGYCLLTVLPLAVESTLIMIDQSLSNLNLTQRTAGPRPRAQARPAGTCAGTDGI